MKLGTIIPIILTFLCVLYPSGHAATYYVPDDFSTIQAAIDAAADGDAVIVRPGTYLENLVVNGSITLKSEQGPAVTTIDGGQSGPVARFYSNDPSSIIEGFTITNGSSSVGAGICCPGNGWALTIKGNVITGNTATASYNGGGGVYCGDECTVIIVDNTITGNDTDGQGGGVLCEDSTSDTLLIGNNISDNTARLDGGGVACLRCSPTISGNSIDRNTSLFGKGGGIYCRYASTNPVISGNTISENRVDNGTGGGICCEECSPSVAGNSFTANYAYNGGGGISCFGSSSADITGNVISRNTTPTTGGGIICISSASPKIHNNLIFNNSADFHGGGIYFTYLSNLTVSNCTFTQNSAGWSGGGISTFDATPTVIDSIIWDNTAPSNPEIDVRSTGGPFVDYCDVKMNTGVYPGTGNINVNPLFYDSANDDFHLQQDPCQPGITNLCVDVGSDTAANLGMDTLTTRTDNLPDEGQVDMGYHYLPPIPQLTLVINPDPLVAGQYATFTVSHGVPYEATYLAYSIVGPGSTYVAPLDVVLDLTKPKQAGGIEISDSLGTAVWNLLIPPSAGGKAVWFQACQYGECTDVVSMTIQ